MPTIDRSLILEVPLFNTYSYISEIMLGFKISEGILSLVPSSDSQMNQIVQVFHLV